MDDGADDGVPRVSALASRGLSLVLMASAGVLLLGAASRTIEELGASGLPVLWWAGRASGLVAYLALWLAMVFGTLISAKSTLLDKRLTMELHRQWSLTALIATLAHVLTLVAHPESGLSPQSAVVPFVAERLTGGVALGVVGLWGLLLIVLSSLLQRRVPYSAWRAIHALAFGTMLLALVHSVTAGTDSAQPLVRALYSITAAIVAGAAAGRATSALVRPRAAGGRRTG